MLRRRTFAAVLLASPWLARAWAQESVEAPLQVQRDDRLLELTYAIKLELPPTLADALQRGVALHFVAEARVRRYRWYWRNAVVAEGERRWRLSYQPLTRQYRVATSGGLSQSFDTLTDALSVIRRASRWTLELREEPELGASYDLEFSLRLDASQLPGPVQIGLGTRAALEARESRPLHPMELGLAS
ncbi:MAG: DUF4390 domain-containing protein [Inhella sp.]|uniref:DUF4390 domain-containing protein n=1 Tax=Inhella sp. TaxID=1921806 RepID=UPI0022BF169E|nr:DUF4390 domain-containing protein [Inhella sp.]MCZ8236620.1 DUF4390 domain-containing protein [Inhella sp.]